MKIYFAGSIRGGRADVETYSDIIKYLRTYGEVLTEHVGDSNITTDGEKVLNDECIHDRDLEWLISSNVVVAEVSSPSLGVGYELGIAVTRGKKILALYKPQDGKKLSGMISGCKDVTKAYYQNIDEAKSAIDEFFRTT